MTQVINTNNPSLIIQSSINKSQSALSNSIRRLSSGLRINSTKDDAADQATANRSTSNIKGLIQTVCNADDGISVAQTTEGVLSEINNNLQRVRELTVQAFTGANSDSDLDSTQDEIKSRLGKVDRMSGQTQSNGVNVLVKDSSMKIQVGANDGETITVGLEKIDSDTLDLNGFNVNGKGTITNRAATVSDLTSAGAESNTTAGLYDPKTENTLLIIDAVFDKLGNGDKVTVGDVDYTYNARSGNFTITKSTAGTGVDAATWATDSAKKRDTLAAAPHTDVDKSVNGSYTTRDGTASFEMDSAGNITIDESQAYVDDAGNSTISNAGSAAEADTKTLLKAASEGSDGAPLTFNGTEHTIAKATPATTSPVAPLIPGGIAYQATVSKNAVSSEIRAATATSSITFNSSVLNKTIRFTAGESSDAARSYMDDKGGITNITDYTVSYNANRDSGSVTIAGYTSATNTNKGCTPAVGTAINVGSAGKITTETTSAGSATTNPLAALNGTISSIDKFRPPLGAIQNRLDSAVTNLNDTTASLSEAQSRIQDTGYATGVSNMSRAQIIQQTGNSVLARANQVPQQVLSLLRG